MSKNKENQDHRIRLFKYSSPEQKRAIFERLLKDIFSSVPLKEKIAFLKRVVKDLNNFR